MLRFAFIFLLNLFLALEVLLEEEYVDLVQSECVNQHNEGRNQKENVQKTSQEREVVKRRVELPVNDLELVGVVEVPVSYHLGVWYLHLIPVHAILVVVLADRLLLGLLVGRKLYEVHLFLPVWVPVFHEVVFESHLCAHEPEALEADSAYFLRIELKLSNSFDEQLVLLHPLVFILVVKLFTEVLSDTGFGRVRLQTDDNFVVEVIVDLFFRLTLPMNLAFSFSLFGSFCAVVAKMHTHSHLRVFDTPESPVKEMVGPESRAVVEDLSVPPINVHSIAAALL